MTDIALTDADLPGLGRSAALPADPAFADVGLSDALLSDAELSADPAFAGVGAADAVPGDAGVSGAAVSRVLGARTMPAVRAAAPPRRWWAKRTAGAVGPAFVVAVAYVDPGNFATNLAGGARHGYQLLWVVVLANVVAMLVQYLSAKLGLATGRSLPELCRQRWPRWVVVLLWAQAELVVMATDLAEFVGAALALHLLFGLPMVPAVAVTALVTCAMLVAAPAGRWFTLVIAVLLAVVVAAFVWQAGRAGVGAGWAGGLVPHIGDADSLLLACGIVGATVMPHAVYLHSGLTGQSVGGGRRALRRTVTDIVVALGIAGVANVAMLAVAAGALHGHGAFAGLDEIRDGLSATLGQVTGLVFAVALLTAGLASTCVGTRSGELVMAGFLGLRVPVALRRAITMAPALVLLSVGIDPTTALVISQVVLSFGLPFALIPLVVLTSRRAVMGEFANRPATVAAGIAVTAVICGLNLLVI